MDSVTPRLGILASRVRYEEKSIMAALERRGAEFEYLDPRSLSVVGAAPREAPSFVFNREIGHFRAYYAASALESAGVTVLNTAAATRVTGDKWHTSAALLGAGLPTPATALAMTPDAALKALEEIGYPAVIKPLVGSWGRLVTRVTDRAMASAVLEYVAALPSPQSHVVYLQELVPKADRDIRVVVVGGTAIGAMHRRGAEWRTNVARGAVSEHCPLSRSHAELAVSAAAAVGADIAGVDLIEDEEGRVTVLEVNGQVEFRGFQEAEGSRVDVGDSIAALLIARAAA
ncbi:RimK family alpha-L-glutamate ligase [Amycolatopsis cihanbeyliensis]|uniref:[lysine-biosynthesis-protein LysW]--L-2-aminoadipate ligase n=1 Tax=Amycolatopsis cihanbeyliensis TaxID=1128664 RepID=A0A542DPV0_AMYCI|nr:RimK family alpha-L-glutamate ligase [Amycolatopsis cihanbeyliensis]TQJ05122.1 [lysine-biosynthesis-protein LysW]--L-2-aminoadipate ligase [Amycolatopsis cihanbeyliensis]